LNGHYLPYYYLKVYYLHHCPDTQKVQQQAPQPHTGTSADPYLTHVLLWE
jgi:hypothetical protein